MRARLPFRLMRAIVAALLLALVVRVFVAVPRRVPSASMMPTLLPGDMLLVTRWPTALPFRRALPRRGDIVVARGPAGEVVKRVIGLPGDRVAMRAGVLILDGRAVARFRGADYLAPAAAIGDCPAPETAATRCRVRRYREQIADGRDWDTLDLGTSSGDDMPERLVPPGRIFLLGDNRDRSGDSRFPPGPGGLGLIDVGAIDGTARLILWSSDEDASRRVGWWRALRRDRTGHDLSRR